MHDMFFIYYAISKFMEPPQEKEKIKKKTKNLKSLNNH